MIFVCVCLQRRKTALALAAEQGHLEVSKLMLSWGANLEVG
jgi:hypothetical protein